MDVKKIYRFLAQLEKNNDREWFASHKEQYQLVKKNVEELARLLITLVAEADSSALRFSEKDVTYRIYRDTRFSADKKPYKTHIGIFINPPHGKKSLRYGYYFQLKPGESFIAAGNMPGPTALTNAIRREIYNNVEEYLEIIRDPEFVKYFPTVGYDPLVKSPAGFPKDWEHIELLKPRSFGAFADVEDAFFSDVDTLPHRLRPIIRQMKRLIDFINFSVDDFEANQ